MRRIYSGHALQRAGPAGLLIVVVAQNTILGMFNNYLAEMCIYMPLSGGFVRMAGKWADGAFGFMAGWNFFFYQAIMPVLYCEWKIVYKTKRLSRLKQTLLGMLLILPHMKRRPLGLTSLLGS